VTAPSLYLWLKAAHVAAVVVFAGGTLAAGIALTILPRLNDGAAASAVLRRWDRRVTVPALAATWVFGLALALQGHWFAQTWLQVKLGLVLVLTAIHGLQAGRLRRLGSASLATSDGGTAAPSRSVLLAIACVALIAVLAVVKPG
jgi:uncharacterized membrane protein